MSSLRNAVQRRNHRERAQPVERQKWGFLEKKKDYVLRARDYNSKKARLKALEEKAATRNPDEFYFSMVNSKTKNGIPTADRGNEPLSAEAVKLLKTQDAGYLRMKSAAERKAIERLEEEVAFGQVVNREGSGSRKRKHIVFVESKDEAEDFEPATHFGTNPDLVDRAYNRPRIEQLTSTDLQNIATPEDEMVASKVSKGRAAKLRELAARMKRAEHLREVETELDLQRERLTKGRQLKKNKWAQVRKR